MIPEAASGMIETEYTVTPMRTWYKKDKLYEANAENQQT